MNRCGGYRAAVTQQSPTKTRLASIAILGTLILLTWWTVSLLGRALDSSVPLDAPTAPGQVVDVGGRRSNWIKVEYTLPDGRRLSAKTSEFGTDDMVVGREVVVRYDSTDPEDVAIGKVQLDHTGDWTLVGLLGVGAVFVVGIALRGARRR